ncbi:MAG: DNA polymerase IV, partial [Methanoregulaceae archaeon]|nr:DNA polymerase IV [Methanoregulaceae archaeon]
THTRARTLGQYTREIPVIRKEAWALAREFLDGGKIRLIGIRLSKFLETGQAQMSIDEFIQG